MKAISGWTHGWGRAVMGAAMMVWAVAGWGTVNPDPQTPPDAVSDAVGSLGGAFRVNEQGAATYTVALVVPPGTAGVAPQIGLMYSSSAGNGLVGQGWSLTGLSAITRCRQTKYQDGAAAPITWTDADRFCLDGQRLVLASGTYGAVGATYRTETESYATITAVGGTAGHPDYFTVQGKDGVLRTYGEAGAGSGVDSEQEAREGSVETGKVLSWNLDTLADNIGNRIDFLYYDEVQGHRIKEIRYAYGAGSSVGAKLVFVYAERDDDLRGYVAGYEFRTEKRLARVDVHGRSYSYTGSAGTTFTEPGLTVVRSYLLAYGASSGADPLSRLTSLQECNGTNGTVVCYPPTSFAWTVPAAGFLAAHVSQPDAFDTEIPVVSKPGDVNGDGKMDLVWMQGDLGASPRIRWAKSSGTTLVPQNGTNDINVVMPKKEDYAYTFHVIDYDNDGYADLLRPNQATNTWVVHLSNDVRLTNTFIDTGIALSNAVSSLVADINADGLPDLIYDNGVDEAGNSKYGARLMTWLPNAGVNGFSTTETTVTFEHLPPPADSISVLLEGLVNFKSARVVDFNGDGLADIAGVMTRLVLSSVQGLITEQWLVVFQQTSVGTFVIRSAYELAVPGDPEKVYFVPGDINNDGLTDYLFSESEAADWRYYINTGTGFVLQDQNLGDLPGDEAVQFIDYNRDGFVDILHPPVVSNTGVLRVRLYNPDTGGFRTPQDTTIAYKNLNRDVYHFIDVNGDGHAEGVRLYTGVDNANIEIHHPASHGPTTAVNTVSTFTDGVGAVTALTYGSLNQPLVHVVERDANAVWPLYLAQTLGKDHPVIDVMPPTFVVTNATSSAPRAGTTAGLAQVDAGATSAVDYFYTGAKIQGAGRGFLGFHKITSIDGQTGLWTTTTYRQDYPFVGRPYTTEVFRQDGLYLLRPVSMAWDWWAFQDWGTHTSAPYPLYKLFSFEVGYDPDVDPTTNNLLSYAYTNIPITNNVPSIDAWGNVTDMQAVRCDPKAADPCAVALATTRTQSTYGTTEAQRRMGRLTEAVVTHSRAEVADAPGMPDPPDPPNIVRTTQFTYHANQLLATERVVRNVAEGGDRVTTHEYDAFGNRTRTSVTARVDETTNQTRYTRWQYDARGRFADRSWVGTGNAALPEVRTQAVWERTALGQPVRVQSEDALEARIRYGYLGREYERYGSDGAHATTTYGRGVRAECPAGLTAFHAETVANRDAAVAGSGARSVRCHDVLGRMVREATSGFDGTWIYRDTTFDASGRVRHQSQPYYATGGTAYWTTTGYDALGRVVSVQDPKGGTTTTAYTGFVTTVTNAAGQQRREERSGLGEVVGVADHLAITGTTGAVTEYAYDAAGTLVQVVVKAYGNNRAAGVPAAITTGMSYDAWGRKTALVDPDKGAWSYTYNGFDELLEQTDARGQRTRFAHDALGRVLQRTDYRADATVAGVAEWTFDRCDEDPGDQVPAVEVAGRLLCETLTEDGELKVAKLYAYDALKRGIATVVALQDQPGRTTVQAYDSFGRVEARSTDAGSAPWSGVRYAYNARGYPTTVQDLAGTLTYRTVSAMDARGNVTQEELGNGYRRQRAVEPERGLVQAIRTADAANLTDVQDLTLAWDAVGNLTSRRDAGGTRDTTERYTYDALNRLRTVQLDGVQTDAISYDAFGNIKTKTGIGTYSYASAAGPHAVTATSTGGRTYQYDANGNLVYDSSGRAVHHSTFDKPVRVGTGETDYTAFRYGPDRALYKRVDKVAGTVEATTWYTGDVEVVVKDNVVRDVRRYIDDVAVVVEHYDAAGQPTGSELHYLLRDHLGSVVGFMDGAVLAREQGFDAWGRREVAGWASYMTVGGAAWTAIQAMTDRGFTGHRHVDRMDLIHMNGRTYDPKLGRFMQADILVQSPFDTQSYNRYSYLMNNPLNGTDPSGYKSFSLKEFTGVIIGGALLAWHPLGYGIWQSAVYGAIAGGSGAAVNGGNVLQGVAIGAFSAAAFAGLDGAGFGWGAAGDVGQHALNIAASGVLGGTVTVLQGGKFGHGFASAGFMAAAGSGIRAGIRTPGGRIVASAIAGGTVSEISGGKFANGAMTAAFQAAAGEMADSGGTQVAEGEAGDGKTYGGQEAYDKAEKALQANEELATRTGSSSTHSYKDVHAVFKNINGDNVVEILGGAEIDATVGSSLQAYNQAHGGGWRVALGACRLATTCTIYRGATVTSTGYGGLNYQRTYSASTRSSVESVIATMAHEYGHYRGFADHETSDPYQKTYGYQQTQAINAFRGY